MAFTDADKCHDISAEFTAFYCMIRQKHVQSINNNVVTGW